MFKLPCRGTIALAAVGVALLWSNPADAQVGVHPGAARGPGIFQLYRGTGFPYEVVHQAKAERRLQHLRAKLGRDSERGNPDAVESDLRRIHKARYQIMVDEWMIRKIALQDPGFYPYPLRLDPITCEAIALATRPAWGP